jgi:hypothetical protein
VYPAGTKGDGIPGYLSIIEDEKVLANDLTHMLGLF